MRRRTWTIRRVLLMTVPLVVMSSAVSSITDAARLDKSFVGSTISTTHWAGTGFADAQILAITAAQGAGNVSATLDGSSASPASPGPNTSSTPSTSSTGVMGLGLTASSDESVTLTRSTTASSSPSQPAAEAKITVAVTLAIRVGLTTTAVTLTGTIARGACALTV